jgi:hypothetical protein
MAPRRGAAEEDRVHRPTTELRDGLIARTHDEHGPVSRPAPGRCLGPPVWPVSLPSPVRAGRGARFPPTPGCPVVPVGARPARHHSRVYGTNGRRQAFSSAAPAGCPAPQQRDTLARVRPFGPFCRDLRPARHGRPGTPSNGRTTERQRSRWESSGGLTKARWAEGARGRGGHGAVPLANRLVLLRRCR